MKLARNEVFEDLAREVSKEIISDGSILGLGSGSTVAGLLVEVAKILKRKGRVIRTVPTSMQIQIVAEKAGLPINAFHGVVDVVVDGADQVDSELNLIKGGGGALLKEKILISSAKKKIIVADESKFVRKLCMNSVRVPIEVSPFGREVAKRRIALLGGAPQERLLEKGYPYFTENGNIILDTLFKPISRPAKLERDLKSIPGVMEVGIFTIKPLVVYKISSGRFVRLTS